MGLTSALNTSVNGLSLNETSIDVLGNNIANAGTNGFKASNVLFTTQLSRTLSIGSRSSINLGGTNPRQIGLGATTAAIARDFTQGSVTNSANPSDLAIQGDGFFIVNGGTGDAYTRAGNFSLNSEHQLVNPQGLKVQGYGVDTNFGLVKTKTGDVSVPLGELNVAQRTQNVKLTGALRPTGDVATHGSQIQSAVLYADSGHNTLADANTALTSVYEASSNQPLFTNGQTLSFSARKGGRTLDAVSLPVGATTTLKELADLIQDSLGIDADPAVPNDGTTGGRPGVSINAAGQIEIVGNQGTANDLSVAAGDLTTGGSAVPIGFDKQAAADGESAVTDFIAYDSLGSPVDLKLTAALESVTPASTTFRWYAESADDSRRGSAIATGTVTFDSVGNVIAGGKAAFSIQRDNTAAVSPQQITLDLSDVSGISSESAGSKLNLGSQDGSAPGTLVNFAIDENGVVNGIFDNGAIRTLGQVTLARFSNPQGLIDAGGGTFSEGVSSGPPFLTTAGNFGAGTIRSGAIELSNTDIGRNLVDLIVASTNYRGNARVISSVQQLVDELLALGR